MRYPVSGPARSITGFWPLFWGVWPWVSDLITLGTPV